jgi:LacI family transcriptional regulator
MDREASRHGYLLLLSNLHSGGGQAANALRAMRGRVDALAVMAPHLSADELASALPKGIPAILINTREGPGHHAAIHLDNAAGVHDLVNHVAATGRKRIVHIAGPMDNIDAQERAASFRAAVAAHGLQAEVVQGDFTLESGESAIANLLSRGAKFDAVFAANDNMAIGAIQALRDGCVSLPDQVAVAGFDDIPLARHLGITTVRVRIAELGERAIERLIDGLGGQGSGADELHAPELVVRMTTDPRPGP